MTERQDLGIVIQAVKKAVAFQDDLVKKLAGVSLIERAIEKAKVLAVKDDHVYVLTDSEEIELIAIRNGVSVFFDSELTRDIFATKNEITYLKTVASNNQSIVGLSPYAPLLSVQTVLNAHIALKKSDKDALRPVVRISGIAGDQQKHVTIDSLFTPRQCDYIEKNSGAFFILKGELFLRSLNNPISVLAWETEDALLEIESYQDWWVAEKLLKRRRIVFRVIGNELVGMGHIYRALTLAHGITDHEVLFVCETKDHDAVDKLAGYDYWFESYESDQMLHKIMELEPDLVINDILSTNKDDIKKMRSGGARVINFEDLGSGATESNLTINELYEKPKIDGDHILWGHNYFFVRDEFDNATPVKFDQKVSALLLTFGGTDQRNLTGKIYTALQAYCVADNILIYIVTGPGYKEYNRLIDDTKDAPNVLITHDTGVMSGIMEQVQLAVTSNGRTVYELAHMNIPAIVVSQHERENTHSFATRENGFINVGVYHKGTTERLVQNELQNLVNNHEHRENLYDKLVSYNFDHNRNQVLQLINGMLDK